MQISAQAKILIAYWTVLVCSAIFLYFDIKPVAFSEPLLVPLLALYLFWHDAHISQPRGKLVFFSGMFLAFLGDIMQIAINNEVFFLSSVIAFMLMNICYSISFYTLDRTMLRRPWKFLISNILIGITGYCFIGHIGDENLGDYKIPLIIYIGSLSIMISLVISLSENKKYKRVVIAFLFPGTLIFMLQNMFLALNLFHFGSQSNLYTYSILPYGVAMFLIVKGMKKIYSGTR